MDISTLITRMLATLQTKAQLPISLPEIGSGTGNMSAVSVLVISVGFLLLSAVLTKIWIGIVNVSLLDDEPLSSIEKRQPYLPSFGMIIAGIVATVLLLLVSVRTMGSIAPFMGPGGDERAYGTIGGFAIFAIILLLAWKGSKEYIFSVVSGTVSSFILIAFTRSLLDAGTSQSPVVIALSVVAVILVWKFLFGPWDARAKVVLLGTFLFWITFHTLSLETSSERFAHLIAIGIAAVPAAVWCALFLPYHKERMSVVLMMFFSGMLSTAPILFYDALTKRGVELQFFVFKITPQNFTLTVQTFIREVSNADPLQINLLSLFVTFLFVGLLEEGSKYWVLRRNGQHFFTSIDDSIQLAVVAAIGFAFAENITTTGYFFTFVREFLRDGQNGDWASLFGNIAGRSILTSMVHILSTGVMGYFLGVALFHDATQKEAVAGKRKMWVGDGIHWLVGVRKQSSFRTEMIAIGLGLAVFLHAFSNFLVSLPEVLPGNPRTFGDLVHAPAGSPLHYIALLLVPALLYVVGGFWVLTTLFLRKENSKERGHLVSSEVFVMAE